MIHMPHFELEFPKTGSQIVAKAKLKIDALGLKIADRKKRIDTIVKSKNLRPEDLIGITGHVHAKMSTYGASNAVGASAFDGLLAGEQSALQTETQAIENEKDQIKNLKLIVRNLPTAKKFKLDFSQLEYLGF